MQNDEKERCRRAKVSASVDLSDMEVIEAIAAAERRTISQVVRNMVAAGVAARVFAGNEQRGAA